MTERNRPNDDRSARDPESHRPAPPGARTPEAGSIGRGEPDREDILLHRAIDGSAGVADWAELELLARKDAEVWRRLALGMRGELSLRRAGHALETSLPALPDAPGETTGRAPLLVGGLGWAAALIIAFCWLGSAGLAPSSSDDPNPNDATAPGEAWNSYLASGGGVVQELEPVVVEAVPSLDGTTLEVVFVRRALERTRLAEVQVLQEDDAGTVSATPIPVLNLVHHDL